ncbi:hypothetical protein [Leisingera thetidis]|uniref:hypothetical protein n=1 Tax=Leisingera thetidis TaxID=2930199 RepID=UPI0021F6BD6E|nr:hypothetical protein [Leisingera thetidis]
MELDPSGVYVTGAGHAPRLSERMIEVPAGMEPSRFMTSYIQDGVLVPRPVPPSPVPVDGGWEITGCPVGTQVMVFDVIGGELLDQFTAAAGNQDYAFSFPDPGTYRVEVDAPLPFTDTKTVIEVPE